MSDTDPYELVECPACGVRYLLWTRGLVAHTCKCCGVRSPGEKWRVVEGEATLDSGGKRMSEQQRELTVSNSEALMLESLQRGMDAILEAERDRWRWDPQRQVLSERDREMILAATEEMKRGEQIREANEAKRSREIHAQCQAGDILVALVRRDGLEESRADREKVRQAFRLAEAFVEECEHRRAMMEVSLHKEAGR